MRKGLKLSTSADSGLHVGDEAKTSGLAPILFATSNHEKFLQANLVLGVRGFEVQVLKKHQDPYPEPYGLPGKDAFLGAGLKAVLKRAGGSRLVFIEDTTVRFPVLRTDHGFPGRATKEWFKEASHAELLAQLDARGSREVVVRSNVALHIPGLRRYLFLQGECRGSLVDELVDPEPNPLYPWLGKSDFNSWFTPDGADRPLAHMALEESLRFDFRVKSFAQLADRLEEFAAILNLPYPSRTPVVPPTPHVLDSQLVLFEEERPGPLVVVTGALASGKTTVGHYLVQRHRFRHVEGSSAMTEAASLVELPLGQDNFETAARLYQLEGDDAVERLRIVPLLREDRRPLVYTGCRTPAGLALLRDECQRQGRAMETIYLHTRSSVRLARATTRRRHGIPVAPRDFFEASERDLELGFGKDGRFHADTVIRNDGSFNELLNKVDLVLNHLAKKQRID